MEIAISIPPEDNKAISKDNQLDLALQQIEEEEVQNMENKWQMVIRDGYFSTMIQQQEED